MVLVDGRIATPGRDREWWENVVGRVIVVKCQPNLFQVVRALNSSRRLAGRLNGGQQQRDQHRDDRDDYQ